MGSSARVAVGAALAVPVAIFLFFVMHSLVSRDFKQEDVKARKIADIVVPDKTIETILNEVKPEKIEDPEEPPPEAPGPRRSSAPTPVPMAARRASWTARSARLRQRTIA